MRKVIIFMFACMLSMGAMAQATKTIKGAVIDKSGNPLPGATVEATGGAESVTTDADGTFTMEVPIWLKSVTAKYPGYKDQIQKVGYADIIFEMGKGSKVYNRITWGYNPQFLTGSDMKELEGSKTMQGVSFNWTIGSKLGNTNLYLETGLWAQYNIWKYKRTYYWIYNIWGNNHKYIPEIRSREIETTSHYLSVTVPVQVAYQWNVSKDIKIQPYLGIHLKANIMGLEPSEFCTSCGDFHEDSHYNVGFDEGKIAPLQAGMQFGVGAAFKKFYLGAGYSVDFNHFWNKVKATSSTFNLSLGIQF